MATERGQAVGAGDSGDAQGVDLGLTHEQRVARVLALGPNASTAVRNVVAATCGLCDESLVGDLSNGPKLADSVIVLAQITHVLQSELARRVTVAAHSGVLRDTPRVTLNSAGGISGTQVSALLAAGAFADQHHALAELWSAGRINVDIVAAIARGLSPLSSEDQGKVVAALAPTLPGLSVRQVRKVVARAVDLLTPDDRDRTEQRRHDRRFLAFCNFAGMTMIRGELPSIDGAALQAALHALAESLRTADDGLTRGQRYADALMTLVNAAAAHGDLPATTSGLPVAASITISLTEAERLLDASGHDHSPSAGISGCGTGSGRDRKWLGVGSAAGIAHVPESDTTLGDAAARFALCSADLTGVIVTHPVQAGVAGSSTSGGHGGTGGTGGTGGGASNGPPGQATPQSPLAAALAATRLEPLAVGRATRLATKAQRTALAIRDGGCVIPGCERPPAECQTHHVTDWAAGGRTDCDQMALLCWSHHRQVDLNRWRLVRNPDPEGPYWRVTPVRRHAWRHRDAA